MEPRMAMNALDSRQTDALTELINIAFGLTASKLSEISGFRVLIDVPIVGIRPVAVLARELGSLETGKVSVVHQAFTGPVSGDAMLLLSYEGGLRLGSLFMEDGLQSNRFDSSTEEILTEIGNMLLGACLGVLGNLLEVRVTFSPPVLHLGFLKPVLKEICIEGYERRQTVVVATSFHIRQQEVAGQFAIALGATSLQRLIQAVDVWEGSQCPA